MNKKKIVPIIGIVGLVFGLRGPGTLADPRLDALPAPPVCLVEPRLVDGHRKSIPPVGFIVNGAQQLGSQALVRVLLGASDGFSEELLGFGCE